MYVVFGFLYSLRCKDDCYEIGLAGRGVGKQLGPDTDVTHTQAPCRYREGWRIQSIVIRILKEDYFLCNFSKVSFAFCMQLSESLPSRPVLLGLSRTKFCSCRRTKTEPNFFFLLFSLSEALHYQNHGVVIWEKDDSRGAVEEEPESLE